MTLRDDMKVKELFSQACGRADGIAMYLVSLFFIAFSAYAVIAQYTDMPLFLPYTKAISTALLAPVTFMAYVYLAYFSTTGKISRIANMVILLAIPFLFFYKSLN